MSELTDLIHKNKHLISELFEVARLVSGIRIDLEKILDSKDSNYLSCLAQFAPLWSETISNAAARGMDSCALKFEHPNPMNLSVEQVRTSIIAEVQAYFEDTGFRVLQFCDWNVLHECVESVGEDTVFSIKSRIDVRILITWESPCIQEALEPAS